MNIQFLGAAQTVTGSCFEIAAGQSRLLVDCGAGLNKVPWRIDVGPGVGNHADDQLGEPVLGQLGGIGDAGEFFSWADAQCGGMSGGEAPISATPPPMAR